MTIQEIKQAIVGRTLVTLGKKEERYKIRDVFVMWKDYYIISGEGNEDIALSSDEICHLADEKWVWKAFSRDCKILVYIEKDNDIYWEKYLKVIVNEQNKRI